MAEKIDFDDLISSTEPEKARPRRKQPSSKTKLAVIVSGVVIIGGLFTFGVTQYFQPTNFNDRTVALTENISQWSPLKWNVESELELVNSFGTWTRDDASDYFENEEIGCLMLPATVAGASAGDNLPGDLENTEAYTSIFSESTNIVTTTGTVPYNEGAGSVEMMVATYEGKNGSPGLAYYRNAVESERVSLLNITCSDETGYLQFNSLTGEELFSELNIWLVNR